MTSPLLLSSPVGGRLSLDLDERWAWRQRRPLVTSEVAPFQWTVCQLAVYVLVMAACMSAS